MSGHFEGIFTSKETPAERRQRKEQLLRERERLTRGMSPEARQRILDEAELALFGTLRVDGWEE